MTPSGDSGFEQLLKLSKYLNTTVDVLLYGDINATKESVAPFSLDSLLTKTDNCFEGSFIVDLKIKPLNKK